jgi:hypothetical protein
MRSHKVSGFAVKSDEQGAELVDPRKSRFTAKAALVDSRIQQALGAAFGAFTRPLVCRDVRNDFVVEARPASSFGIESGIGIEVTADNRNPKRLMN